MHWKFTAYSLIYLLTGTVTLVTALINWRQRKRAGIYALALSIFFSSIWLFVNGVEMAIVETGYKIALIYLENVIANLFVTLMFIFIIDYYQLLLSVRKMLRWALWLPLGVYTLMSLTNDWHHLIWKNVGSGPPESNMIFFDYGPFYYIGNIYFFLLLGISFYILVYQSIQSKSWDRARTIAMAVSLIPPVAGFVVYVLWPNQDIGFVMMPFGFTFFSLLLSWIVFEDLQFELVQKTRELQTSIGSLKKEIEVRQQLEADLKQSQDSLALRLAEQSQKMAGLYDMVIIGSQSLDVGQVLQQAIGKIQTVMESQATCFFRQEGERLYLEAQTGLEHDQQDVFAHLASGWLSSAYDVRADINIHESSDLPGEILHSGYGACLWKRVTLYEKVIGVVSTFWPTPHNFSIEEIALYSALSDELGVILENARLRQVVTRKAVMQERRRLARDLHDSVNQSLHSLIVYAETGQQLLKTRPEGLENVLTLLVASARQALKEMRLLLYEMRLTSLADTSLVEALQIRLEAVEQRAGIEAELVVDDGTEWPKNWEYELYPIAMEALNNALKHAFARRVEVHVSHTEKCFFMEIRDDGQGFDCSMTGMGGMGLRTMAERAERLGGELEMISGPGEGTIIRVTLQKDAVRKILPVSIDHRN